MSNSIKLNLVNHSNDQNNSSVVIFQKNVATDYEEPAVAWRVIDYLIKGNHHPFIYSPELLEAGFEDAHGNYTPLFPVSNGNTYKAIRDRSGDQIKLGEEENHPMQISIENGLTEAIVHLIIYRDGKELARKSGVAPGQRAHFEFKPAIWIGAVSLVEEGQLMGPAIVTNIDTELSLEGIASADIIWSGGGNGPSADPFRFSLENVVKA